MSRNQNRRNAKSYEKNGKSNSSSNSSSKGRRNRGNMPLDSEVTNDKSNACNDLAWYSESPQLVLDSCSIPAAQVTGLPLFLERTTSPTGNDAVLPGIMAFSTALRPSDLSTADSSFNVAVNQLTALTRRSNSGAKNWDAPDLGIYILAVANLYAMMTWAQRLYGTATLYASMNRYLPDALFDIQKVDGDNIRNNLSNFRLGLNVLINKVSSLPLPISIPLAKKWAWIFSYYYADSNYSKDQMYMYYPINYYTFDYDSDSAGMLKENFISNVIAGEKMTYTEILDVINTMVNALLNDQDICIMGGDLLKAFGSSNWLFSEIPENYYAGISAEPEVLWQMRNIQCPLHYDVSDIVQDSDKRFLIQATDTKIDLNSTIVGLRGTAGPQPNGIFLHHLELPVLFMSDSDSIAPGEYMTGTRQTCICTDFTAGDSEYTVHYSHGSTVVTGIRLLFREHSISEGIQTKMIDFSDTLAVVLNKASTTYGFYIAENDFEDLVGVYSKFQYAPNLWVYYIAAPNTPRKMALPFGAAKNYAVINRDVLQNIHRVADMSETGMLRLTQNDVFRG